MVDKEMQENLENALRKVNIIETGDYDDYLESLNINLRLLTNDQKKELFLIMYLNKEEYDAYQKFIYSQHNNPFYYVIDELDKVTDRASELLNEKRKCKKTIRDAKKEKDNIKFELASVLPLVRLNILYSQFDSYWNKYIKLNTRVGMKRAKYIDEIEEKELKNVLYRMLCNGKIKELKSEFNKYNIESKDELDNARTEYIEAGKKYYLSLKEEFFKIFKSKILSKAIILNYNLILNTDINSDNFYEIEDIKDTKIKEELYDEIYSNFISFADFNEEIPLTGDIFYEAVLRYLYHYYDVIISRNEIKIARSMNEVREINSQQKELLNDIKELNLSSLGFVDSFSKDESDTMALVRSKNN